ncbi:hypothetical protein EW146_g6767 [Bondarzewia mesenterica]|uniref:RING-type E3 ubiquitin transferase n=1 Tax=Bondarzewia mesenterica TaxID=1095465 RepID=A0A4S4LMM5_9AGAM|nr:hypothetical protein EW146_g6767 [Bondarzewia mesenterica]
MDRPSTSKPRGICRYYQTSRGCFQGHKCKFLHGEDDKLTPYDKNKACRYFAAGYCKRGADCWFKHVLPDPATSTTSPEALPIPPSPLPSDERSCGICFEEPDTFGLLSDCSHVFCITCLRGWRDSDKSEDIQLSGVNKKCPYCRAQSKFVTPSSHFYPHGHPGKTATIERYKASMARVACKYFEESKPDNPFCPFGSDCLYKHENVDGTQYIFSHGVDYYMAQWRMRRRQSRSNLSDDEDDTPLAFDQLIRFGGLNFFLGPDIPRTAGGYGDHSGDRLRSENSRVDDQNGHRQTEDSLGTPFNDSFEELSRLVTALDMPAFALPASSSSPVPPVPNPVRISNPVWLQRSRLASAANASSSSLPDLSSVSNSDSDYPAEDADDVMDSGDSDSINIVIEAPPTDASLRNRLSAAYTQFLASADMLNRALAEQPSSEHDGDSRSDLPGAIDGDQPVVEHPRVSVSDVVPVATLPASQLVSLDSGVVEHAISLTVQGGQMTADEGALPSSPSSVEKGGRLPQAGSEVPAFPALEHDADPPFMTDGRGRVVWSRSGSKAGSSAGAGRGRRRADGVDGTERGEREGVQELVRHEEGARQDR